MAEEASTWRTDTYAGGPRPNALKADDAFDAFVNRDPNVTLLMVRDAYRAVAGYEYAQGVDPASLNVICIVRRAVLEIDNKGNDLTGDPREFISRTFGSRRHGTSGTIDAKETALRMYDDLQENPFIQGIQNALATEAAQKAQQ